MSEPNSTDVAALAVTPELVKSLIADYEAGRLPADVMARIDELREDFYDRTSDRFRDMRDEVVNGTTEFGRDLLAELEATEAQNGAAAGRISEEFMDTDLAALAIKAQDGLLTQFAEPIIEASVDVAGDVFETARELVNVRFDHDPDGRYAALRPQFETEFESYIAQFDASVDAMHENLDGAHEAADAARELLEEHHADQGVTRLHMKTTIDPDLDDAIEAETGQTLG
jgi:hypothetical protein